MPERFRNKPVEITAIRWTGDNILQVMAFMRPQEPIYVNNLSHMNFTNADDLVGIATAAGVKVASKGDWIVRDAAGELSPCKADVFEAMYEPVVDDA